jgi:GT2 family glycosyltransferase
VTPVLAIPFLGHADELRACIDSIDIPVRLVVIDNTTQGIALDVVPDDAWVIEPPGNLGYAASVNLVIKALPHEDYWLFANHDVVFAPGDLHSLAESEGLGWTGVVDWRVFKLTAETVQRVGLWDEHFVPCYVEDADYERRCSLAGIRWGFIEGETTHVGSIVLREHGADNARSYPENVRYHHAKWGVGVRMSGGFTTPFDAGGSVADGTQPDLSRLRALSWHRPDGGA